MTSLWWPTTARPSDWFTAVEIDTSAAYHRPLLWVTMLRTSAQAAGLIAAAWFCRTQISPAGNWWIRLLAASLLASLAVWVPATASDWWFDQRHQPKFEIDALPARQLAVGSSVAWLGTVIGLGLLAAVVFGTISSASWWWMALTPVLVVGGLLASVIQHRFYLSAHSLVPLSCPALAVFVEMARTAGVEGVSFYLMSPTTDIGCNALLTSSRWMVPRGDTQRTIRFRIAVTQKLLDAPIESQRLIVGHELGHARHHHLGHQFIATALTTATVGMVASSVLANDALWVETAGTAPDDPRGLPALIGLMAVVSVVLGLISAWVERAHERKADAVALRLCGLRAAGTVRELYVEDLADLDPPLFSRLLSAHPTPAERLQHAKVASGRLK